MAARVLYPVGLAHLPYSFYDALGRKQCGIVSGGGGGDL